jgi:hypothetical protein
MAADICIVPGGWMHDEYTGYFKVPASKLVSAYPEAISKETVKPTR